MKEVTPENKGIHKVFQAPRSGKRMTHNTGQSGEFSKILLAHLESETPGSPPSPDGLPELSATYAKNPEQVLGFDTEIAKQISKGLDLLEGYAKGLADPATSLKQAFDLLEQIGSQTRDIELKMADIQNQDPRLKEITAHLSTLAAVEKIKINRGDYS